MQVSTASGSDRVWSMDNTIELIIDPVATARGTDLLSARTDLKQNYLH
jgi:hypothetical protein